MMDLKFVRFAYSPCHERTAVRIPSGHTSISSTASLSSSFLFVPFPFGSAPVSSLHEYYWSLVLLFVQPDDELGNKLFSFRVTREKNQVIGSPVHVVPHVRGDTGAGMSSQG